MISPDSMEDHQRYGETVHGEPLPWLIVCDPTAETGARYGALREEEHEHGGFWNRTLWIVNRDGVITHRARPWEVSGSEATQGMLDAYQQLFTWLGAEAGQYFEFCGVGTPERKALDAWEPRRTRPHRLLSAQVRRVK